MRIRHLYLVGCIVAASVAVALADTRTHEQRQIKRARGMLKLLTEEKYQAFTADVAESAKSQLTADVVRDAWTQVVRKLGRVRSERSVEMQTIDEFDSVQFECDCERGTLTMRIVLTADRQLTGLWFDKAEPHPASTAPAVAESKNFREEKVTVSAGQFDLPGTLSIPNTRGPHAGVVLVHGSGPNNQDGKVGANRPLKDLAWGLASHGIAVLRYDKRSYRYRSAYPANEWTLERETIEDVLAALQLLRGRKEIDPKRVFIVGHSMGGFLAPFIARQDGQTAGIATLAANSRSILDVILDQHEYKALLDDKITKDERAAIEQLRKVFAPIREGRLDEVSPASGLPVKYLYRLHTLDPVAEVQKLDIPVLILQGERDFQVSMKNFALWKEGLGDRPKTTFKSYPKLNHLFITGEEKSRASEYGIPGHVDEQVIDDLAGWIKSIQVPATAPH